MSLLTMGRKVGRKVPALSLGLYAKKELINAKSSVPLKFPISTGSSGFFSRVQNEEISQRWDKRRHRVSCKANNTAALILPYSNEQLMAMQGNESALLALCEPYIIEHANRRVDLFFYTLVAYYRSNLLPSEGRTDLQHGKGRTINGLNVTQACHSSFTPSLEDNGNRNALTNYKSILSGTHFFDSLNSTVELPPFVNAFDDLLEHICRPKALDLLTDVAEGTINPIHGLTRFLNLMSNLLGDFKEQAANTKYQALVHSSFAEPHYVHPKLINLIYRGTLKTTFSTKWMNVNEDYIQLLLRLTADEKACCKRVPQIRELIYMNKIMEIKGEILATPSGIGAGYTNSRGLS